MHISTDNGTIRNLVGDRKALQMIAEAGFQGIDYTFYGMNAEHDIFEQPREDRYALAMRLREDAEKRGIAFPQSHAGFAYRYGVDQSDKSYQDILKSLEFSSWLGCRQVVIHTLKFPRETLCEEASDEINRAFLRGFLPLCEQLDLDIGIENLFQYDAKRHCYYGQHGTPDKMNRFVDSLESPRFKVCCDLGHAALTGTEPEDFISGMAADRLTMLHVHDITYLEDSHTLPYLGKQNWDGITSALAGIGYSGWMNLEVLNFYQSFPPELLPTALRSACSVAEYLARKTEEKAKAL